MWDVLTRNRGACSRFRAALEDSGEIAEARNLAEVLAALPAALREHAATCSGCQFAANTFLASRTLLQAVLALTDSTDSSFASRVMAMIAARENQLRRRVDSWISAVPKLAAKLTWATAAALLLAGTLLYEQPKSAPPAPAANVSTPEYLFETPAAAATDDDVLVALLEK